MFKTGGKGHGLSHDPMDNNVRHQCSVITTKIFGELPWKKEGEIWNYYQLMMREFINQRKPTTPEELKSLLTIKDLGVEVSPEEAEAIRDYKFI